MDFNTPEGRLAAIETLGITEYNRQLEEHRRKSVVATVNGHDIRPVSTRFGRLFAVDGTTMAFSTLEQATKFAQEN